MLKESIINIKAKSGDCRVYTNRNHERTINVLRNMADLLESRYLKLRRLKTMNKLEEKEKPNPYYEESLTTDIYP